MVVYPGGQSRGDTPPHEILTSGAAGCPAESENRKKEESKECPFYRDTELPFPTRDTCLGLGVLQPDDCPRGLRRFYKDYDMSLTTEDLYRAKPLLAHPTTGNGAPVPWKLLEKPPLEEVPRSRPKSHYPAVQPARPRDLALTTSDIDGCQPRGTGGNCEGRHREKPVDPLNPSYKLSGSITESLPSAKASGRHSLDVSDIQGAATRLIIPVRNQYGDPLRVDDEFKSRKHLAALAELRARTFGLAAEAEQAPASPRRACCTPRLEGPHLSNRSTNPLTPRYRVPLARDSPGTSLCITFAEEQRVMGANMPMESGEIGHIPGSQPDSHHHDKGTSLSLETRDVTGAQPLRRIGAMAYSIYGPYGKRREWNGSLDTRDIRGAQADTLIRYPKVSSLNSARSPADGDQMSARGKLLRTCPEKI